MLMFLIFITCFSTILSEKKKFGYFSMESSGISNPLNASERESSPMKYHFRLSRKNKREKEISATFQVIRKIVDLKIQSSLYKFDRTSGYVLAIQKPLRSFCYDEKPIFPLLKRSLAWPVDKTECSLEKGNYTSSGYSLEEETKWYIGSQTFYGVYLTRILFMEGEDLRIAGVDLYYEIIEAKDFNATTSNGVK